MADLANLSADELAEKAHAMRYADPYSRIAAWEEAFEACASERDAAVRERFNHGRDEYWRGYKAAEAEVARLRTALYRTGDAEVIREVRRIVSAALAGGDSE